MAIGWGAAAANTALDSLGATYRWVQLHDGAPGSDGTSNVAASGTRKQATWAAATGGQLLTSAELLWTALPEIDTFLYASIWSLSSGGVFWRSATVSALPVATGGQFRIPSGLLVVALPLAS